MAEVVLPPPVEQPLDEDTEEGLDAVQPVEARVHDSAALDESSSGAQRVVSQATVDGGAVEAAAAAPAEPADEPEPAPSAARPVATPPVEARASRLRFWQRRRDDEDVDDATPGEPGVPKHVRVIPGHGPLRETSSGSWGAEPAMPTPRDEADDPADEAPVARESGRVDDAAASANGAPAPRPAPATHPPRRRVRSRRRRR